jgi:Domain of unknown function (DUF4105)
VSGTVCARARERARVTRPALASGFAAAFTAANGPAGAQAQAPARVRAALRRVALRTRHCVALGAVCAAIMSSTLRAQRAIDWSTRPVLLMTIGQGDEVFEKFGHNSIVVWDDVVGQPLVYNWGMFDFRQPNFIGRFLSGDTKYWMEPRTMAQTMEQYTYLNRTVTTQELQLTTTQKARLVAMLRTNALEENKYYRYDYYRDNCSTRARDAIDAVTGGALRRTMLQQPGAGSYRWHTRRLLAYDAPLYFGAELVLGVDADPVLNAWEEAFLPQSLSESLQRIRIPAAEGLPERALVAPIDTLFRAQRAAEPRAVFYKIGFAAAIGAAIGLVMLLLTRMGRVGGAIALGAWGLVSAVIGCVLFGMWLLTKHVYMANNPSVALLNPLWLAAAVAGVLVVRGGVPDRVRSVLRWLVIVAVVGTAGVMLLGHAGSALELAALALPGHAAALYAAGRYRRR